MSNPPILNPDGRQRRHRMSGEEYRELLLAEGQEILIDEGLSLGADRITFKRVFDRIKPRGLTITNASIIGRVWENQDAYQRELILAVARHNFAGEFPQTLAALDGALQRVDRSSPDSRWASFDDILRTMSVAALADITASKLWPVWLGAWTRWHNSGEVWDAEMRHAISDGEGAQHARTVSLFESIFEAVGLRPRTPHDVHEWATAVLSLLSGFAIRSAADERAHDAVRATGNEWNLPGLMLRALARDILEVVSVD